MANDPWAVVGAEPVSPDPGPAGADPWAVVSTGAPLTLQQKRERGRGVARGAYAGSVASAIEGAGNVLSAGLSLAKPGLDKLAGLAGYEVDAETPERVAADIARPYRQIEQTAPKPEGALQDVIAAGVGMVPALAALPAGPAGPAAIMAAQGANTAARRAKAAGKAGTQGAAIATLGNATLQGELGSISADALIGRPVEEVAKALPAALRGRLPSLLAELGLEATGQGLIGAAQKAGENATIRSFVDPRQSLTEGVAGAAGANALLGAAGRAVIRAPDYLPGAREGAAKPSAPADDVGAGARNEPADGWAPVSQEPADKPANDLEPPFGPVVTPEAKDSQAPPAKPEPEPDITDQALDVLRKGGKARPDRGQTLMEWLASRGGVADTGGELSAMDAERWHRDRPFQPRLVKEGGADLGDAAHAAYKAGFFPEFGRVGMEGADNLRPVTRDHLVEAIGNELAGRPRYAREADPRQAELASHVDDLEELLHHVGADVNTLTNAQVRQRIDEFMREPSHVQGTAVTPRQTAGAHPQDSVRPGDLWKLDEAQLSDLHARAQARDQESLVRAFGSKEAADEFARLDRRRNSSNPRVSDEASAEFDRRYGNLTPEQERLVYGIGEEGVPQVDDIRDVLRASQDSHDLTDATDQQVVDHAAQSFASLRPEAVGRVLQGQGRPEEQARFLSLRNAYAEIGRRGLGDNLQERLVGSLVRRGYGKESDVREVVGSTLEGLSRMGLGGRKLPAPDQRVLGVSEPPKTERVRLANGEAEQNLIPGVEPVNDTARAIAQRIKEREAKRRNIAPEDGDLFTPAQPKTGDLFGVMPSEEPGAGAEPPEGGEPRPAAGPQGSSNTARSGLRQAPELRPSAATGPADTGAAGSPAHSIAQLAQRLRTALGLTARQGRMTLRRALGEYHPDSGVVRVRAVHELDVLAHEGGHALEGKSLPGLDAAIKAHGKLLKGLSYPGAPKGTERSEGFAEFFRWYVTNPTHAQRAGGPFYADFEAALAAEAPKVLSDLRGIQTAYQELLHSSASGVLASMVVPKERSTWLSQRAQIYREDGPVGLARFLADEAWTRLGDKFHPINVALERLRETALANGRTPPDLPTAKNPYRLSRMASGAYSSGHMDIMAGVHGYHQIEPEGPSLRDALLMADAFHGDALNDFGAYLVARRMVHEWQRYQKGGLSKPPDGASLAFHMRAIRDLDAAHPKWADAAQLIYQWNANLWRKEFDAGLISKDAYERGLADHPDYVPLMRDVSDKAGARGRAAQGNGKFAGGVKRFRGSTRQFINPVQSMMERAYQLNTVIARNDALRALVDVADMAGPGSAAIVERIPAKELEATNVDALEAAAAAAREGGMAGRDITTLLEDLEIALEGNTQGTIYRKVPISERGEPIVYFWKGGERQPIRLADGPFGQMMFEAIAGMAPQQKSLLLDVLAATSRVQRIGITSHPAFLAANFIRDQLSATILTDVGYKPFVSGARGMAQELSGSKVARQYNALGGIMGGGNVASLGDARRALKPKALKESPTSPARFISWRGLAHFTELSETGTRLGVFRNAVAKNKRAGMSDYEAFKDAAFQARDYFDTELHGSRMLWARRTLTFLNAGIQGLSKAARVMTAEGAVLRKARTPTERAMQVHAYKAWAGIAALSILGLGLRALYANDPEYAEFDDRERATHWFFKAGGVWWRVPKPFELAAGSNALERMFERYALRDPTAWDRLAVGLREILIPPVQTPAVTIPLEIATNRDYAGRPIVPDSLRGVVDPEMQFNSYTSELAKFLGRQLHMSPAVIDHAISGFGGSAGREVSTLSNMARPKATRQAPGAEDVPILSRFASAPERSSASAAKFWDLLAATGGKLSERVGSFREIITGGDAKAAQAYLQKLSPLERSYVLSQVFSEKGSGKLNPLERAKASNAVISGLRRDLAGGAVTGRSGQPIQLTPVQRRDVDRALADLQLAELHNGLKAAGVPGWSQQEYLPRAAVLDRLREVSAPTSGLLELRLRLAKVPTVGQSAEVWPLLERRLESLATRQLPALVERERASNPSTKLDAALRRKGAMQSGNALADYRAGAALADH
jgi:hypothetical protein